MKKILVILFILAFKITYAQQTYWQQHLNYTIDVSLNDKENLLTGFETIIYKNNSPQKLDFIWFHLWPNAYQNDSTALMLQIKNDISRQKKLQKHTYGSIYGIDFKVNGVQASTEAHPNPQFIDIVKLKLAQPLYPGDSVNISTYFNVKLPSYFSRSGFSDGQFMLTQWYPKPAVFDKDGWHEMPYLDMGEFYSEYADYKVNITLPSPYIVGATGVLQNTDELAQYKKIGLVNTASKGNNILPYQATNKKASKTLTYSIKNVPDFAWFADKNFAIQYDTIKLASGKCIDAFTYYHPQSSKLWVNSINYTKNAVSCYSRWLGEYEYPIVQVVEGPKNNSSGGMEYPTITLITSPNAKPETLDAVITHEVGHNWFMSMLGTNERKHTWMDEGLNTYFQYRYEAEKYKSNSLFGNMIPQDTKALPTNQFLAQIYTQIGNIPFKSAIDIPATEFLTADDYGLTSYIKTALWVYVLEASVGREKIDAAFQNYFKLWKNKHPAPADLKASFEEILGANLDDYFKMLKQEGTFR
ncbi:MAG: M1 family peptidase [Sphingobacteriales bacterium]|nr:MAG: M1 family peptidase [Sphingobacteriales bacterium]